MDMSTTGLKLSILALASNEITSKGISASADTWVQSAVGVMIIAALVYVYRDMRSVHRDKELILSKHTQEQKDLMIAHSGCLQKIMNEHKQDVAVIVKDQIKAAADIAKVAAELAASSNEVLRDNVQIMVEVKNVIRDNTAAVIWCRDSAIARANNQRDHNG